MVYIEVSKLKDQEDKQKIEKKKHEKILNEESKPKKKFNPFKDMKYKKVKNDPEDELANLKKQIVEEQFILEQKDVYVNQANDTEEGQTIYNHAFSIMALPERNPIKRQIFQSRLRQNPAVQNYVKENIVFNALTRVNHHLRFALHYGLEYNNTNDVYNDLVIRAQQQQQQQMQQPPQEPEKTEKTEEPSNIEDITDTVSVKTESDT